MQLRHLMWLYPTHHEEGIQVLIFLGVASLIPITSFQRRMRLIFLWVCDPIFGPEKL